MFALVQCELVDCRPTVVSVNDAAGESIPLATVKPTLPGASILSLHIDPEEAVNAQRISVLADDLTSPN